MTPHQILKETASAASEYLEMTQYPAEMLAGILAAKLALANDKIEYLERRLAHECCSR